ncbi:prolyl oligopeptidase family serine peptidase [Bacillus sp. NEB1478]|uniref:alpha/beta hydrolase family protein n=1 Tax=Bacillus sp. NEB1478 TaxID=3073816 RepID=UPI002872C953|nr:prolyl oligopeptidase family serine peptidase [Bacillus sp. NEB1478]WNB93062.1 prolyl oligopeptidase family serine peptidase [Bacillus sp. NEB1478]
MKRGKILEWQRFPSPHPTIRLYVVTYLNEGLKIKGLAAIPGGKGPFPGFLYLRGGIKSVGMVRIARIIQFASQGFVVMAPYYRGNLGGEGNEDFAGKDRTDAFAAFDVLKQFPKVDQDEIHVFGFSRGGPMALFTAIEFPEIRSIVTWGGVTDMAATYREREDLRRMMKRVIGGTPDKYPEEYEWRSPLFYCNELHIPLLAIHGMKDENVLVHHTIDIEKRLKELDKPCETWIYPAYTHYFPPKENRRITYALCEWMKGYKKRS